MSLKPDGSSDRHVDRHYILQICSNFLVIDRWTEVRFAHLSVIEFLKGGTFGEMFSDTRTHAQAAETCLSCLQPNARLEASKMYKGRFDAYFFSGYAGRFWLAHCRSTSEEERRYGLLGELYAEFLSDAESKPIFIAWMDFCRSNNEVYQERTDIEIQASAPLGPLFSRLAKLLHGTYHSGTLGRTGPQPTALHHAVEWNSILMVSLLIGNGANIDAVGGSGGTPYHRAVILGHDDIAQFLLQHGSDANKAIVVQKTPTESLTEPFAALMQGAVIRRREAKI